MKPIRAFIAVEIDDHNKQKITSLISQLKQSNADVKWITENQMHLTLKFLGSINEALVENISKALEPITKSLQSFTIKLSDDIEAFPGIKHPNIIWVGIGKGITLFFYCLYKLLSNSMR